MGLESASFVSQLNSSNPTNSDQVSAGDDHIRLIKAALIATFPNLSAAVTVTPAEINFLAGVTSSVQTQLNSKALTAHVHSESDIQDGGVFPRLSANEQIAGIWTFQAQPIFSAGAQLQSRADFVQTLANTGFDSWFSNVNWAANDKFWTISIGADGKSWTVNLVNDALAKKAGLSILKNAGAITSVVYGNVTDNPTHIFYGNLTINGQLAIGNVSYAELQFLDGVTSAIQTQIDAKASSSHGHAAGDISSGTFNDARIAQSNVTQHQAALAIGANQVSTTVTTNSGTAISVSSGMSETFQNLTGASAIIVTIPDAHGFSAGKSVAFIRDTTSTVTFAVSGAQQIKAAGGRLTIPEQNGMVVATYKGSNVWSLTGV